MNKEEKKQLKERLRGEVIKCYICGDFGRGITLKRKGKDYVCQYCG